MGLGCEASNSVVQNLLNFINKRNVPQGNYCILCIGIVWCIQKIDIISENKQKSLNTRISFNHIYFIDEFKLILYPQSRNSITHLTIRDIQDIGTLMCKIPT